jgi:predicted PurR-regulated permease PerM
MNSVDDYPFYIKYPSILLSIMLTIIVAIYGRDILLPFAFALLLSMLLDPVRTFFVRYKIPNVLSILLSIILAIAILTLLFYFLSSQIAVFADAIPNIKQKLLQLVNQLQQWFEATFHVSTTKQMDLLRKGGSNLLQNGGAVIGQTLSAVTGVIIVFTLLPVYIFLLMYYKPLLLRFIIDVFSSGKENSSIKKILNSVKLVIRSYIVGLLMEASIVATLNCIGLLILGIDYALLLGVLGALLNMIPYIGGIIAIALPVLIALATKPGLIYPVAVVGVYLLIQFIDNNLLVPRIVASKVRINALISIVTVLIGGALWGVAGMFLSIPFIAIFKIIFDNVESLKPYGMLLGDELPQEIDMKVPKTSSPMQNDSSEKGK